MGEAEGALENDVFWALMLAGSLRLSMSLRASKKRILSIPHLMNSCSVFSMRSLS